MRQRDHNLDDRLELVIGLVNNMPKAASRTTEAQFQRLLDLASRRQSVSVKLLSLPACTTSDQAVDGACTQHPDLSGLKGIHIDGMIVTGSEPKADHITDEPMWPSMARLVDWANDHTVSTVWSCLAAHAAVYQMDGLSRQRLSGKLSGVFGCSKTSDHYLVEDLPPGWAVPHSRQNGLDAESLARQGYQVLSRSPRAGLDMAVKQDKSLFVILQGHPEYGAESLSREYLRDVRRFLAGERECHPDIPESYFDEDTTATLNALREQATRRRDPALLPGVDRAVSALPAPSWDAAAVSLYARWLSYLTEHKPYTAVRPAMTALTN